MRAILIIQEAKYKLVYLIASLTLRLHSTEQCIHKHNTNYTIEKYTHRKITQCKLHASIRPYMFITNTSTGALQLIVPLNNEHFMQTKDVFPRGTRNVPQIKQVYTCNSTINLS